MHAEFKGTRNSAECRIPRGPHGGHKTRSSLRRDRLKVFSVEFFMQGLCISRIPVPIVAVSLICFAWCSLAFAYIDLAPTLSKILADSKKIALAEVVEWNRDKQVLVLKEVKALKGDLSTELIRHELEPTASVSIPRQIQVWAAPGCALRSF